jgi:hypothetical protein
VACCALGPPRPIPPSSSSAASLDNKTGGHGPSLPSDRVAKVLALAAKLSDEGRAELAERLRRTVPTPSGAEWEATPRERVEAMHAVATEVHVLSESTRMALVKNGESTPATCSLTSRSERNLCSGARRHVNWPRR